MARFVAFGRCRLFRKGRSTAAFVSFPPENQTILQIVRFARRNGAPRVGQGANKA
jgi:hypothetical protein